MSSDYASICSDFYVNQRLNLKMDLQMRRDTVLSLFDRVRRERAGMDRFKRYSNELALESRSTAEDPSYQWVAVRKTSVRSGSVNHDSDASAHDLHRLVLEAAPYFLDISPLDVDHLEILFGFDMLAAGNHDAIVFNALLAGSPIATLCDRPSVTPVDCQPVFGVALSDDGRLQAHFEVKTRSAERHGRASEGREDPISLYLIIRQHGPFNDIRALPAAYNTLVARGEELLERRIVPNLLIPIRDAISAA